MRKRVLSFLLACFMIVSTIVVSTPHIYVNAATIANGTTWTMKSDFDSTLNDGVFTLKALNRTTNEIITPVWSDTALDWNGQLTDKWQATVPCWEYNGTVDVNEAFVFCLELNETILTSMPLKTYDENGGVVYIAAAVAFTAPADGVYKIEAKFKQHHGSGGSDRMQTYSIVYGTQVIDTKTSVTGGEVSISGEVTIKEGDIAWIIHEVEPQSSNFGGLGADVNEIKVTKTADPEILFTEGVNQWTLPMDWSTGLKTENTGNSPEWDLAEKGNWKLTAFTNPSDISTILSAPASETAASATNTGGVGPKPYIESANNANYTYGAVNNTSWYVNAGARWRDVIFAKGNNSSFMKVAPRNFPSGNSPTVVFTAPEDGLYSYSELVTGVKFADANGAAVIATATVRKNGLVIDSFTPTEDAASKTLKGKVVLEEGDLLMFTFTLNTAANIKDCDSGNEQVFNLGSTVVCKIGGIPAEYAEIDHTPIFAGDSATSTDGNTVLKGYDVDADTFYDVEMQAHPNPDESDKWIAYDPKATNNWDNSATAWSETLYYGRLWSGVKNGAIIGVGGSQQYKSGAALVFTVPNDGLYAISARFTNGNFSAQPCYSDFIITVNGEVVSTQTNYSAVNFTSLQAVATDVSYFGELKANDEVVIMKKPNANTTVCNTSNDGDSTIQITEIKNLPTDAEEEPVQAQTWEMPTAWRTELDKDDNGWDLASKNNGLWRLTSFVDPSDISTMRWAPSTDKLSNATSSNHQQLSPESYIESKDNRAQFSSEKTYWYVNYGHRYQMKAFHGNDGEDFFYAIPGNDSATETYNNPTIVFTAPVTGTYDFTELATLNVSGATVTATVRKNGTVLKTADLNADGVTLAGDVQLEKGDLLMFTYTLTNSFDATDNTLIVKISDVSVSVRGTGNEGDEGGSVEAQTWDMPTAWRTELDKDDNGWDLASKNNGLWRLTSFADPSDITTMRWAPSTDKLSNATSSNHQELSPESYIESKDNRAQFSSEKTYWYVNYGHRYQMKAFHGNDGEDFFYAIPGNDSATETYNNPTIVFTAPVTGTYDFTELATLNVSGATVTATVRKNGTVLKTSDLNADGVTLAGDVQLEKGDLLMFTYTLTNSFDATDNTLIVKISDVSVSVRGTGGEGGEGGEGEGGETPTPIDPILGETIGGGTGATGGVAAVGSKWDLPTDFYTGMTSAGEKRNGNWQLATYDLTTLKTYYKFGAPDASHSASNWYFQASEPYEGQYGTFAYSSRGFETNPGSASHPEVASVIIFTAPADGLYKFNADTFSYGASNSGAGSRAVIFYVMKDGVIYAITNPSYLNNNTESLSGYIALKQGEQIYFCAQRYTHYTHSSSDWPAWIGARYEALSVEKVAELTSGDELATRWHFTPDGSGLTYGHFEMKGYDFVNKTVTDATFNSGSDWTVTSASGNVLFWKSSAANSVCGWGPDGTQTNKDEGAAIVFTAPTDGTYNVTGHFEKTYVKSSIGNHYCDYKVILEDGTVVFDGTNYDESATESFSGLVHTLGASVELKQGDKIYIVKSPNASAAAGAQGGEIHSVTVTRVATITPPAPPDVRPPYEEIPTAIGTSFDLPMNWWSTGVFDENGWELARQGQWRLTSFANPDKVDSIRFDGSKAPIGSNVTNDKSPWSYIETLANRATIAGGKPSQWYVNYESRWSPGTAFTMGDDQNYMLATPASGSRSNNPAVVFIAPDDGSYSYKHFVEAGMFEKSGAPVTTSVTVRVNGEVVETFVPSENTPSKTMHGLLRLKAGDVVAFVYSLTSNAAVANHDPVIKVGHANITKVDDYVDTNGHHCYGGTATCTTPAICEGCQQPYGKVDLENHVPQCVPTYDKNATTHTEFWSECGQTLDPEKHTWVEGVCAVCDYACQHPGDKRAATCISGAICNECEMAHGDKNPNAHVDGLEFAFEYATKKVHYTRWSCCESKFTESDHTFENGKCTVCELEEGNQGDLAGMEPGTGTDYDVVPNPGFGAGRNPVTGTISIIAVITASVVSAFAGKAATKKRRRRI